MTREVKNHTCLHCESSYKLMFDLNATSGFPRFCCFCGEETYNEDLVPEEDDDG